VGAAVASAVLGFNLLGDPPLRAEGSDWVDFTVTRLAFDRDRLVWDAAASLLFAVAFVALAGVGLLLGRAWSAARDHGSVLAALFLVAAILGATAQLLHVGAVQAATEPTICDCGYRAEEIIGRLQALQLADSGQTWLMHGALLSAAVGLTLAAALGSAASWPRWLLVTSWLIAALLVAGVAATLLELELLPDLIVLATAGVLLPVWAIGVARRETRPA
jgi:hypothetical protein